MLCVSCGGLKGKRGKRTCPALLGSICTTCCGTKRLKEIACPADCQYLATALAHPAAAVLRQRERDLPLLSSLLDGLNATQSDLLALLTSQVRSARAGAIPPLRDQDIREAAGALASTLETAARGIVYEHQPASMPALRMMRGWQQALAEIERRGQTLRPAVVAPVLRRIEQLARDAAKTLGVDSDTQAEVAFLDFLDRVMRGPAAGERDAAAPEGGGAGSGLLYSANAPSGLIVP